MAQRELGLTEDGMAGPITCTAMLGNSETFIVHDALVRARSLIGFYPYTKGKSQPIRYRLAAGFNGGRDPTAQHPASWSPPDGSNRPWGIHGAWTCDCSGFVSWCLRIDRYQDDFPFYGGWISTNSILAACKANSDWFRFVDDPEPEDLIVYGKSSTVAVGHVGIVHTINGSGTNPKDISVIHCSASNDRRFGGAIQLTDGSAWAGKPFRYVRYVG